MPHSTQGFRWCRLSLRLSVYARDGWCCLACGRRGTWRKGRGKWTDRRSTALSLDHYDADRGNTADNLLTLCLACNTSRHGQAFAEWRPDLVDAALVALSTPVDRKLGLALAEELDPAFVRRYRGRVRAPSVAASPPPF